MPEVPATVVEIDSRPKGIPHALDEREIDALAAKIAEQGAAGVPEILKMLSAAQTADSTQVIANIRALVSLKASESVSVLAQLAKTTNFPEVAQESWKAIGKLANPAALPSLLFILDAPRDMPYARLLAQNAAMNALAEIAQRDGGAEAFVAQCEELREKATPTGKLRMLEILQKIDTSGSRNVLIQLLKDPDTDVQRVAASAVARTDSPEMIGSVQALLASPNPLVKKEAILALGRCKSQRVMPALIEQLNSTDAGTKANAKWAIQNITGRAFNSVGEAKSWLDAETISAAESMNVLLEQLKSGPPALMPLAIEDLGKLVSVREKLEPALRPFLAHNDFRVRAAACDAIGQASPSPKAIGLLISKLQDSSGVVRSTAWRSLLQMTGQKLPNDYEIWSKWLQKHF
ncbi:MAG TPA: HEAT repeat domain-containing protein [Verrucomicrobiae bacterium]|nr:HEAT repeat domain-containing protein [Verrucomicrobiae bacterium]